MEDPKIKLDLFSDVTGGDKLNFEINYNVEKGKYDDYVMQKVECQSRADKQSQMEDNLESWKMKFKYYKKLDEDDQVPESVHDDSSPNRSIRKSFGMPLGYGDQLGKEEGKWKEGPVLPGNTISLDPL